MISMHQATVPPCLQMLGGLCDVLTKAAAHCEEHGLAPDVLLQARLAPDMFPLLRQVQAASDFARNTAARLAGTPFDRAPNIETNFAELQARLSGTIAFLRDLPPAAFEGAEAREITVPIPNGELRLAGLPYLQGFALPNLYFHTVSAYAILRHNGVALRKRDFIGSFAGLPDSAPPG